MKRERRYITINEAAEICGVHRRTIYYWMNQGFLGTVLRTPTGFPRIDKTLLLTRNNSRRSRHIETFNELRSSNKARKVS